MQTHDIKPKTKRQTKKVVGRGGKRGKTSGRGMKGQNARSGNSKRPETRDMIKKIPKLRGHGKNRGKTVVPKKPNIVVNLASLEANFATGDAVNPASLADKGVITLKKSKPAKVKVLAMGDLTKKLTITDCIVSKTAAEKITAAGGTVEV